MKYSYLLLILILIFVPVRAAASIVTNVVIATALPNRSVSSNTVQTQVQDAPAIACTLSPESGSYYVITGMTLSIPITLENTGAMDDSYTIEVDDDRNWNYTFPVTVGAVKAGESATFTLVVQTPPGRPNISNSVMVTAVSAADKNISDSALYDIYTRKGGKRK